MTNDLKERQFSVDAEEALANAESQEELDRLIQEQKKNQKETAKQQNPFVQLARNEQKIVDNDKLQRQLIAENERYQKALVNNNLNWANYENSLKTQIERDKDFSINHASGSNSSSYSQDEIDAMRRNGMLAENNDAYTLNEIARNEKWKSNALQNQIKANQAYDKIELGTQNALNKLNIRNNFALEQIEKSRNKLKSLYQDEIDKQQYYSEIIDDINKVFKLDNWDVSKTYTTDAMSRLGSGIVESFDEILGAGRILGIDDWRANPLQSLLETLGIMDENKEYINPYKSKVYNDFFKDTLSLDYLKHTLLAESGYTIGMLLQSAMMGGFGTIARLGMSQGLKAVKDTKGLLSKAKALSEELSKASQEALIKGNKGEAKLFGLFNVATDSAIGKVSKHLFTTQMKLYPFRSASRIADIAKDRLALEGKEYNGLSDLNSHDIAMGATSALMDSMEVPTALIGGSLVRKASNALLRSEKTSSKVAGGLLSLAAVPPTAFVTEGVTEAVSTIAELAGTYGVDFSEVMSALWSDNPKDAEWKYAIQEAITIGTVMGGGFVGAGSTIQAVSDIKQGINERNQIAQLQKTKNEQISKGVGQFAREEQYSSKINSFASKIDKAVEDNKMSQEDAKTIKDAYFNQQKTSMNTKNFLDAKIGNKTNGLIAKLKDSKTTLQQKAQYIAEIQIAKKAYQAIDTMNNQINKMVDKAIAKGKTQQVAKAIKEFSVSVQSKEVALKEGLSFNKSFLNNGRTTMFSDMRNIFAENSIATKEEFTNNLKQSMKEAKEYSKNFFKKEQPKTETKVEDEVTVSKQKQQAEAEQTFKQATNRDSKKANAINQAINKTKKQEQIKDRDTERKFIQANKKEEAIEKRNKIDESINNKLLDYSAGKNNAVARTTSNTLQDEILDNVAANEKDIAPVLSTIIRHNKKLNEYSTAKDIQNSFKEEYGIELTTEEANEIHKTIKEQALYMQAYQTEKEVTITKEDGSTETITETNSLDRIIYNVSTSIDELNNGFDELHKAVSEGQDTTELKKYLNDKVDTIHSELVKGIDLANSDSLPSETKAIIKQHMIQLGLHTERIVNNYGKYANMLNSSQLMNYIQTLDNETFIDRFKKALKVFKVVMMNFIQNFESFVKNSGDKLSENMTQLKNDVNEITSKFNTIMEDINNIKEFKNNEEYKEYINGEYTKEFNGLISISRKTKNKLDIYGELLENTFDFNYKAMKDSMVKFAANIVKKIKEGNQKDSYNLFMQLSRIIGDNPLLNIDKNTPYNIIKKTVEDKIDDTSLEYMTKALSLAMLKTISMDRQSAKIFSVEGFKIIDNVIIEDTLAQNFQDITGIDLKNNPIMKSLLLGYADTFMKDNARLNGIYQSFTSSPSSFNTAVTLAKIIDEMDTSKFERTNSKTGEKFFDMRIVDTIINSLKNTNQRTFLKNQFKKSKLKSNGKKSKLEYAIQDYLENGNVFELSQALQREIYQGIKKEQAKTKSYIALMTNDDVGINPIVDMFKLGEKEETKVAYDIINKAIESNNKTIAIANKKSFILNNDKFEIFKETFGEEAVKLEQIELTEKDYALLKQDYLDNYNGIFDRDNPLFYVPVKKFNIQGKYTHTAYYKLPNNPQLLGALSLQGVLDDYRAKFSIVQSETLKNNHLSKLSDTMNNIGDLYTLFENGNKPFHLNFNLQVQNRLDISNSFVNPRSNKLLREFFTLYKFDSTENTFGTDFAVEKIGEEHREAIHMVALLATIDGSYDKTPFKISEDGNAVQWIITDKNGNDVTEQAMKDLNTFVDDYINGKQEALTFLNNLIEKQGNSFDFTDDGNTNLTNLLVLKRSFQKGEIALNNMIIELDGLSTGISETSQYMNTNSEFIEKSLSIQKYFVVDNNIYSGYLNEANLAKMKFKKEPSLENVIAALRFDVYGNTIANIYDAYKGLNSYTENIFIDTLNHTFYKDASNPSKVYKKLRDIGKKLVLGPNYGQNITSLIRKESNDSIKTYMKEEFIQDVNTILEQAVKSIGETTTLNEVLSYVARNVKTLNIPKHIGMTIFNYQTQLQENQSPLLNEHYSNNNIGDYINNLFANEKQNAVINFVANTMSFKFFGKNKSVLTQDSLYKLQNFYKTIYTEGRKIFNDIVKEDGSVDIRKIFSSNISKDDKNFKSYQALRQLYYQNKKLFVSTFDLLANNSFEAHEEGFIIDSVADLKRTSDIRQQIGQMKKELFNDTIQQIYYENTKDIVMKHFGLIIEQYNKANPTYKKFLNETFGVDNLANEQFNIDEILNNIDRKDYIYKVLPMMVNFNRPQAHSELYEALIKTYNDINDYIGFNNPDYSNIHLTMAKVNGNINDKQSTTSTINKALGNKQSTIMNINERKIKSLNYFDSNASMFENISLLNNYISNVLNLIEHDLEASIMNAIATDKNLGATISIFDGVFIPPHKAKATAQKWNDMLGNSRIDNKDYSMLATYLRLENMSKVFLTRFKNANKIANDLIKINPEIGNLFNGDVEQAYFASDFYKTLSKMDSFSHLLNDRLLSNSLIIESSEKNIKEYKDKDGEVAGFAITAKSYQYNGEPYYIIVVPKGFKTRLNEKEHQAITVLLHELYHISTRKLFNNITNEEQKKVVDEINFQLYMKVKDLIESIEDKKIKEEVNYHLSQKENSDDIITEEIITGIFANTLTYFNSKEQSFDDKKYQRLLEIAQEAMQYSNYLEYINNKKSDEKFKDIKANEFDLTSHNNPMNMRMFGVKAKNAQKVQIDDTFSYSINQLTFKELRNNPLLNFLSKSDIYAIDEKILPLAVSKHYITTHFDEVQDIDDDAIMLGRNFVISDEVTETSFLDKVYNKLENNENYSYIDAINEIKKASKENRLYFIPKSILNKNILDTIKDSKDTERFNDFLFLINAAMYNKPMLASIGFTSKMFQDNVSKTHQDEEVDIEFSTRGFEEQIKSIDAIAQKQTKTNNIDDAYIDDNTAPRIRYSKKKVDRNTKLDNYKRNGLELTQEQSLQTIDSLINSFKYDKQIPKTTFKNYFEEREKIVDDIKSIIKKAIRNDDIRLIQTNENIENGVYISDNTIVINPKQIKDFELEKTFLKAIVNNLILKVGNRSSRKVTNSYLNAIQSIKNFIQNDKVNEYDIEQLNKAINESIDSNRVFYMDIVKQYVEKYLQNKNFSIYEQIKDKKQFDKAIEVLSQKNLFETYITNSLKYFKDLADKNSIDNFIADLFTNKIDLSKYENTQLSSDFNTMAKEISKEMSGLNKLLLSFATNPYNSILNLLRDAQKTQDTISYQLISGNKERQTKENILSYIDMTNPRNQSVGIEEARESLNDYVDSLGINQQKMISPLIKEISKQLNDTKIIMSSMLNNAYGMSFTHNGQKYIILSTKGIKDNTLAHELGHTLLDSVFRNEDSMGSKNLVSDIKYLQSFILNELNNNPDMLEELGLLTNGSKNNIYQEIAQNANEFVMYFLFDKEKFNYLSNFSIKDLKNRNYKSKQSILGRIFGLLAALIKKVTNLIALRNENPHTTLDEYFTNKLIKMSAYSDPNVAMELDNTFFNNTVEKLNNIVRTIFTSVPALKAFQDVNKWANDNGYTTRDIEQIIDEIKTEFETDESPLSNFINKDYTGLLKPLNIMKLFNVLNYKYYKSPLHRKVAIMMLNRSLNMTNNFLAKEFGRILRDFGVVSTDNQTEIEMLLGQKLSLDQIKSRINNYISLTYQNSKKKLLGDNYSKLEQDDKRWIKPIETDKYNLAHLSPKEMFERSLGSIIGEIQVGKGFNESDANFKSDVDIQDAINSLFSNDENTVENIDMKLSILQSELSKIIDDIYAKNKTFISSTDANSITQKDKNNLVRTIMRKLEILGFTRLTNQVSDSAIENQSEVLRQSDKWFTDMIEHLGVTDEINHLKNKLEQITTFYSIKHIKTLADKDIEIGKYAKQIDFVKSYIAKDNAIEQEQMNSLMLMSSLHSSLVKEAQNYEVFSPTAIDIEKISQYKKEIADILSKTEQTEEDRQNINKLNEMIENIIEDNMYQTSDFQQNNIFGDYTRDGYTKYNYNPEVDIVTIQYNNPKQYDKEQIREYYRQITENNTIESFEDAIAYYRQLGYEVLDNDGNVMTDENEINEKIGNKNSVTLVYKGKFGYNAKYTPYSFIGVKNKTSGSLLSDNLSLSDEQKIAIQKHSYNNFEKEKKILKDKRDYNFERDVYAKIKQNAIDYRYSTNASTQLRTKQSRFMIEKISHLDNSLESQLLALENVVFQKKNADRFNAKLALAILEDNKVIKSSAKETAFARENYIKIIDLYDKTTEEGNDIMFSKNVYKLLRRTLKEYNDGTDEKITELFISPDNAEHLLGMQVDRLSVKATKNVNNGYVRKWLNRIEKIFDIFWNDVKETVLIRNPSVLYQNIISNFSTLTAFGLSPKQIAESSIAIEKDLEVWEKDLQEYSVLQNKLSILENNPYSSKTQIEKYRNDVNILENRLINNRIFYPMMNGVDSNIVDETLVNINEIDNVLKNGLKQVVKKAGLSGVVKESLINNIILSQTSDIYKKAMKFNRYGDIIPRVIAYELFMNKENMDREKALQKAQDFFVNYNIPITSRFLQFFEKIGMQQFIRFNVKVQKAAAMSFMNYPVSTLASLLSINTLQSVVPYGNILFVNPLSNENMINKEYNMFGMLSRNINPFYRWTGFTNILNSR